jgi:mannose-6-phosphate isomerase-like protein (cupin superfamily)
MSHPDSGFVYPEPVYTGSSGMPGARLRRAGTEPELRYPSGGTASYLATRLSTKGQFGLYRWDMAAVPSGPAPHFHRTISESFFILAGTVHLFDGRGWVEAHQHDFLFVPEGGIHGFRNESGEPASMLILFAPGADREDYFERLARVAAGEAMDEEERTRFYLRHDTFWV